mmetsp:Transcript_24742/g.44759  ORF Transcript_24742/g.44759 Transcript_24742/m.44759 type:complete len:853 (+) Transcript_24742:54-2612(+)|eukprot:CAMPEP_0197625082 /NCGR_PEP_ID=MMETSP1338-20131121/4536_1 /TAXON_ID=43686 ORGANISM="Pelagodinium beii, Strain RCC1491" /NCGR_SAMPLE_ID=MMETSP1338 /ASSEMBLY_ACC=CAM_ASM_000754 /LENGTH=852 /DNA_ID=CAMNT_0043195393 /DNA_START=46 /DNA_END=2604 /DNA_ORIENTATION=+
MAPMRLLLSSRLQGLARSGSLQLRGWRPLASLATAKPNVSAIGAAARTLRDAVKSREVTAQIMAEADAEVSSPAAVERLGHELRECDEEIEVMLLGSPLPAAGRKSVAATTPVGPDGGAPCRTVRMVLPEAEDIRRLISTRLEENKAVPKADEIVKILDQYLSEKFVGKASDHVALLTAWGPKALGDSKGEFGEVAALLRMSLKAYQAGLKSQKEDFQFEVQRAGEGRDCLVMPPSNFALLGLKDAFHMLLKGFRILLIVQPRFFPHFREVQLDLEECGLPAGILEVLPGITPEADPGVLHEALKHVDRLQFTGSSAMFKSLVLKAIELGNLRMEHAGEVSGLNKVRLDGVSVSHPAVARGTAWAAMANNGELCTSASLVEFDPASGDSADAVKTALLEAQSAFKLGRDPALAELDVLLREGKSESLEVKTEEPAEGFHEWWEKTILAVPRDGSLNLKTNQSLGHCIYAPSIGRALDCGVQEDASNIYCVGLPEDSSAPCARAGTTGAKLPESVFGGMKTHTYAVAGDHDGVGTAQTLLDNVKRRGANWRDQEEAYSVYELTEVAEMLLEFLSPRDQEPFTRQIANVIDVYDAFMPEATAPYGGQGLVGAEGQSQLVTLQALRPSRKNLLIPRGVGLPEDIVKVALLCEMSPLRELPVDLHLLGAAQVGKLRVTDPLKSFLRVVEKHLGWRVHYHADSDEMAAALEVAEYPPYFFCVKDRHLLPIELLTAVAENGGYFYEGLPTDALSVFRCMTATQAWTVSCTEGQVNEATEALENAWKKVGLRLVPHEPPDVIKPRPRNMDIGGGFGGPGLNVEDDSKWDELSDDEESGDEAAATSTGKPDDQKAAPGGA